MSVFKTNIQGSCPGGFCDYIQQYSEILVVILCLDGFIFFVTLLPPLFTWSNKKADGRKRIFFAALACFTFYFWLAFVAVNSLYCFGFMAHQGPCRKITTSAGETNVTAGTTSAGSTLPASIASNMASNTIVMTSDSKETTILQPTTMAATMLTLPENNIERPVASTKSTRPASTASTSSMMPSSLASVASSVVLSSLSPSTLSSSGGMTSVSDGLSSPASEAAEATAALVSTRSAGVPMALISWTSDKANSSCVQLANEHETQLRNLTLVNILILVVLFIVFIANAREAMTAKALFHKETLCKREEVQRFLSSLVLKPPEVGHLINCFHMAKTNNNKKANVAAVASNMSKKGTKDGGTPRKVVTFSAIENFAYQTWRDFSDCRLIEPSGTYPIIEIEVILNFFPGDHFTAEKYKAFVNQMTKTYSGKDQRITIDDYFHVEDHREWTFFIGNEGYITPWWDKDAAKIPLSCIFLLGWPFRLAYGGRIAKHQVEIKKAVFVENNSADEGVSLSATPASDENAASEAKKAVVVDIKKESIEEDDALGEEEEDGDEDNERKAMLEATIEKPHITSTASSSNHDQFTEHRVNAVVSQPPREIPPQPHQITHPLQQVPQPMSAPVTQPQQHNEQQQHQYFYQQMQVGPSIPTTRKPQIPAFGHPLANVLPPQPSQPPPPPPLQGHGARTKDSVTTVTHQDINGVNTVALKDLDHAQMTQMSGYETYV